MNLKTFFIALIFNSSFSLNTFGQEVTDSSDQPRSLIVMFYAVTGAVLVAIVHFIYQRLKPISKRPNYNPVGISPEELERLSKIKGRCKILDEIDFTVMDEWGMVGIFDELNLFSKRDTSSYSNSITEVHFDGYVEGESPSDAQLELVCYFYNNQKEILNTLCIGFKEAYPKLMGMYNVESYNEEFGFPEIKSNEDIQRIIDIQEIGITREDDGFALLTFWGNCAWDEEHGFGIVMNKREVLKVGDADEAMV